MNMFVTAIPTPTEIKKPRLNNAVFYF